MAQNYSAQYSLDDLTYTALTNVQSIAITIGRQKQLDQYNAGNAVVEVRYPTGYASPITALVPGTYFRFVNLTTSQVMWYGKISNVDTTWGKPYTGGVGNADFITVYAEGSFAAAGRAYGNNTVIAANTVQLQALAATTAMGMTFQAFNYPLYNPMSAQTVSGTWGDWINQLMLSVNGRIIDSNAHAIQYLGPSDIVAGTIGFSDTTNNATNQVYDQIDFGAYTDNYWTQVNVAPSGLANQIVQSGAAPYRTLSVSTFNGNTTEALNFAKYLLNNYKTPAYAITAISCLAEAQNVFKLDQISPDLFYRKFACSIGVQVPITFRGTTYYGIIEGVTMTATPDTSRYTFYISGASLNSYLILGDVVFGRLDFNKLGY